ncbi:hypothetical protein UlMin_001383 [Ulmus minor]
MQGGGSQSHYGVSSGGGGGDEIVEAASPISSRPPASAAVNLDEFMAVSGGGGSSGAILAAEDESVLALVGGEEGDQGGGSRSGGGGNRWPRQETLALLKIRSEMDVAFRDATLKGPLWEDVSRKLAELGYKRSAKKCKEKFENVHKYYKRTKEGRAGRQDGKSYKFFSELEALHGTAGGTSSSAAATAAFSGSVTVPFTTNQVVAPPVSGGVVISNPMPISSFRVSSIPSNPSQTPPIGITTTMFPPDIGAAPSAAPATTATPAPAAPPTGISFSSNSSSSSPSSDEDDDDMEIREPSTAGTSRKRKRESTKQGMMDFFESLMKQVMHKQETMQRRFLEMIEKSEHDRMIRDDAWKRQELARLSREHELAAQERAISATRDAAIISFLQRITGQTIHFPPPPPQPPAPVSQPVSVVVSPPQPPPPPQQQQQQQQHVHHHRRQSQTTEQVVRFQQSSPSPEVVMAVPEQQITPQDHHQPSTGGDGSSEPTSSRWPKQEVLALIKIRSGLEQRYQEAGPKGPLWEEISARMNQMGYKRSSKRCKEKWENINKYYKKVKESNKQRPEDAKTCPYFHQLDALYRQKIIGSSSTSGGDAINQTRPQQQHAILALPPQQQQQEQNLAAPQQQPLDRSEGQSSSSVLAESKKQLQAIPKESAESQTVGGSDNVKTSTSTGLQVSFFGVGSGGPTKKKTL